MLSRREVEEHGGGRDVRVDGAFGIRRRRRDAGPSSEVDHPRHRGHRLVVSLVEAVEVVDSRREFIAALEERVEPRAVAGVASREHQPRSRLASFHRDVRE